MKKIIALVVALSAVGFAAQTVSADQYVNGYYRHDGSYVEGYHRSDPNGNPYDNYSHEGNTNPWTGQPGYEE